MVSTVTPDASWNMIGEASGRSRIGPRGLNITLDEKSKLRELLGEFCNRVRSGSRYSRSSRHLVRLADWCKGRRWLGTAGLGWDQDIHRMSRILVAEVEVAGLLPSRIARSLV